MLLPGWAARIIGGTIVLAGLVLCLLHMWVLAAVFGVVGLWMVVRSEPTRQCPWCAEKIKAEAKVCKWCRKEMPVIDPRAKPKTTGGW